MIISMLKRMESNIPVARFVRRCATQSGLTMLHGEHFINVMERRISSPPETTSTVRMKSLKSLLMQVTWKAEDVEQQKKAPHTTSQMRGLIG